MSGSFHIPYMNISAFRFNSTVDSTLGFVFLIKLFRWLTNKLTESSSVHVTSYRAKGQSSLNAALGGIVCRGGDNLFWNVAMNVPWNTSLVYFLTSVSRPSPQGSVVSLNASRLCLRSPVSCKHCWGCWLHLHSQAGSLQTCKQVPILVP